MTDTPAVAVDARLARGVTPESEVVGDGRVALTPVDDAGYAVIEVDAECVTARAAVPAVELVAAVTEAAGAETEVVEVIEHGTPADVVLEYADEADVDLLVLGTRQRPEAYRTLIGSVTDRVVRLADRPTLVVKTPHEGA